MKFNILRSMVLPMFTLTALCDPMGLNLNAGEKIDYYAVIANLDDDDRDGIADFSDELINGSADLEDFTKIVIKKDYPFKLERVSSDLVNVFIKLKSGFTKTDDKYSKRKVIYVEAKKLADKAQPRKFKLRLQYEKKSGTSGYHFIGFDIAPYVALPNSAKTKSFYISTGAYNNTVMLSQVSDILRDKEINLHKPFVSYNWQDMWMQDTMEVGYTQLPGKDPMYIVLNGIRGYDDFGPTLLGPGMGLVQIGENRKLSGGDDWADWFGNLEVTAPTDKYPLGRVYYGLNSKTNIGLHPDVVSFFEAQGAQKPFSIETSYLTIKHVDEILNFVKDKSGRDHMIIGSTSLALDMDITQDEIYEKGFIIEKQRPYNLYIQKALDQIKSKVMRELNWPRNRIVELPVLYKAGHNIWSNPINSVYLNGSIVTGETYLPEVVREEIEQKFYDLGLDVYFLSDKVYQDRYGNVHCSSNTKKVPLVKDYSEIVFK